MDRRFCALCGRVARTASGAGPVPAGRASLDEILQFLNDEQVRATDAAVAQLLGVPARSMSGLLGDRRAEASWVVNAETGLPADYDQTDWHPGLLAKSDVIRGGNELTLRLTLWRRRRA